MLVMGGVKVKRNNDEDMLMSVGLVVWVKKIIKIRLWL